MISGTFSQVPFITLFPSQNIIRFLSDLCLIMFFVVKFPEIRLDEKQGLSYTHDCECIYTYMKDIFELFPNTSSNAIYCLTKCYRTGLLPDVFE